MEKQKELQMIPLKKGDNILISVITTQFNTNRKVHKQIKGLFIKDYGAFIQIYDKFKIRRSINKQDIVKIEMEG